MPLIRVIDRTLGPVNEVLVSLTRHRQVFSPFVRWVHFLSMLLVESFKIVQVATQIGCCAVLP